MKKILSLFLLLLFAVSGVAQVKTKWVIDESNWLKTITPGQNVVLKEGPNTGYWSTGGYLNSGDGDVMSVLTEECIWQFEEVGTTAAGDITYCLKNVANGMYLSVNKPELGNTNTYFTNYVTSKDDAFEFTAKIAVADSEDYTECVQSNREPDAAGNCFVFCDVAEQVYMGFCANPSWWQYTDTNAWYVYAAEEKDITGLEMIEEILLLDLPGGVSKVLYPVGDVPGCMSQEAYDALKTAYDTAESLYAQGENADNETCIAAAVALRTALDEANAAIVPVTPGYYYILGGPDSNRGVCEEGGLRWYEPFEIPSEISISNLDYVWQVVETEEAGKFYLRNSLSGKYVGTHAYQSQMIPMTADPQETYSFLYPAKNGSGYVDIVNTTRGKNFSLNTAADKTVVFWSTGAGTNSLFKVLPIDESQLSSLAEALEQAERNEALRELYDSALGAYDSFREYTCSADVENGVYAQRGLVTQASQLSSNALQEDPADGQGYAGLVDSDFTTYFHSRWVGEAVEGYHYLQVDFTKKVQAVILKMSQRLNYMNNGNPVAFEIYATNDPDGEWNYEGSYTVDWKYNVTEAGNEYENCTGLANVRMSASYRYIRFTVKATTLNGLFGVYPFFYLSEFDAYEQVYDADNSVYEKVDADIRAEFEKQLAVAKSELGAGMATETTYKALRSAYSVLLSCMTEERLVDGELYGHDAASVPLTLSYTREFSNTEWQALYVPFPMNYSDWAAEFEVARINNMHQYDDDEDGQVDRTELEVILLKDGSTVEANRPYVIRAREAGTKAIILNGVQLSAAEENSIDCSSVDVKYTFTGTYTGVPGAEMLSGQYYALVGGELLQAASDAADLGTYRWYMKAESRNGSASKFPSRMKVRVVDPSGTATGIAPASTGASSSCEVYAIDGRSLGRFDSLTEARKHLPKGLYIVNGKKIIIR